MAYAFALPVLPGKAEAARRFVREVLGPRRADWDDLQRRQGVTRESYFLQTAPEGDLLLVVGEGTFAPVAAWIDPARIPFDRWFIEQVRDVTGVDVRELGGDLPEHLGDWRP
jgi:hypothetical protein